MNKYSVSRRTVTNISTNVESLIKKAETSNVSFKAKTVWEVQHKHPSDRDVCIVLEDP